MEKNDFEAIELGKGAVRVYDLGAARLHAYQTNDPLADEVFVVERGGRGFVIELPCFRDNIAELEAYVRGQDIAVEGIVAAYHMAGGSFMPGTPVYSTGEAEAYGHEGGGKALVDGFAAAFGEAFDASVAQVTNLVEGDELELAGVCMRLVRNADAFDLELPELGAAYLHMLGHDCHSMASVLPSRHSSYTQFSASTRNACRRMTRCRVSSASGTKAGTTSKTFFKLRALSFCFCPKVRGGSPLEARWRRKRPF